MTKEDTSGGEPGRFSAPKRRDLFLNEYLTNTNEERQDVIFRRVRGILNKITPETFDKLSKDLVNVGLDSPRTLRGLIYLLFDKALKDLKYSSLYAKLCQKLSEKSPNFEKEPGPNTFCKFLISKCEDEFERRRKATEDFECKKELTDEEFELKVIAKQKMLGNIKFICELGKKRLLQEEILHECIRGLLSRKKERPLQDQAQDLECLCQIMRTIGSLLDIETSKNLMNQYFERIDMYSRKQELPSRIRFMLRDVIDLRNNNWRPRPFQREDNVPQPLSKLREEAGFSNTTSSAPIDKIGNTKNLMNMNNLSRMTASKLSSLLIDDDEPGFTTTTDFHWGSTAFLPHENEFDIFSSNTYNHSGMSHASTIVNQTKAQNSTNSPNSLFESPTVSIRSSSNFQGLSNTPSSGPVAPRFLQTSRYESFVGAGQNNFDTFVNSSQIKDNSRACHDRETTSILNDRATGRRNDQLNDRNTAPGRANDRRFPRKDMPQSQNNFSRPSQANNVKPYDFDTTTAITHTQSLKDEHSKCNNFVRNNMSQHHNPHQPQLQRHHTKNVDTHDEISIPKPYINSPRPLPPNRISENALGTRNTFMARNQQPYDMPPPSHPAHPLAQPSLVPLNGAEQQHLRSNQSEQQGLPTNLAQAPNNNPQVHRQNQLPSLNGNTRARRFERGLDRGVDHEPRQPKFSGANYRLPGRDRPAPQNIPRNPNLPPESELNLDWRSANTTRSTQQPSVDSSSESQPATQTLTPKHNLVNISDNSDRQRFENKPHIFGKGSIDIPSKLETGVSKISCNQDPGYPDSRPSATLIRSRQQQQQQQGLDQSKVSTQNDYFVLDLHRRRTPSPVQPRKASTVEARLHTNRDLPPPRFNHIHVSSNEITNADSNLHQGPRHRRSNHDMQDSKPAQQEPIVSTAHNNRNESRERIHSKERKDFKNRDEKHPFRQTAPQQRQLGNSRHDNDQQQNHQRNNDSFNNHDRKISNRPPQMNRNQSTEGHNIDFKRGPNWRNESSVQSNQVPKKDVLPIQNSIVSAHHQVLTRPPIRMSETDFSLRPSHNLVGRAVVEVSSKPAEKVVDVAGDKTAPVSQPETKLTIRSPAELSAKQAFEFKKPFEVTIVSDSNDKPPTKSDPTERNTSKFMSILQEYLLDSTCDLAKLNAKLKNLKIPKEYHEDCLVDAMKHTITKSEQDRERTSKLFSQLIPATFESLALLNALQTIFKQMKALEVETPKVKSLVAGFLSRAVVDGLLTIEEVARVLTGGKHHPLFLLFLQKLEKGAGQAWLSERFIMSKINLMDMLPEVDRTKDRLASALKDRCLGFLDPMLTIEPDLWEQMRDKDPSPAAVYRWIKENVDQTIQSTPTFAQVFISCLLKYIHSVTSERLSNNNNNNNNNINQQNKDSDSSDSNKSSPTNSSSQGVNDHEKELLSKYQQMMHAILKDKQMQLATLYALQSFYHGLNFPKGALLRWFHMLYDLSIVDDDVYFIWKEEINDKVPGKGQALFQVNSWLNWLGEPDSEEEEE